MALFDIRTWIYPGADPDADPGDWGTEEDVTEYVRRPGQDGGQVISYSGGKGDEAPGVDAGQMALTWDNRDGRFSTDNRSGPYYGSLDLGCPIRVGVISFSDTFTRTGSSGWGSPDSSLGWTWTHTGTLSNWTTNGSQGNVIVPAANTAVSATAGNADGKDLDVVATVIPAAVATGALFGMGFMLRVTDSSNYLRAVLWFDLLGVLRLTLYRVVAGVSTTIGDLNPIPTVTYSAAQRWRLRVQVDGNIIRAKAWAEAGSEPAAWMISGEDVTATGTGVRLYIARFLGNTNSGATSLLGLDDLEVLPFEFTGSIVSLPVRWDRSGNNSWAPITAAGILRRITQGTYPLQSPLRRQLGGTADTSTYIPGEDGAYATTLASVTRGQFPANFTGVTPASDSTLPGGGPAPTITTTGGKISAETNRASGGTGLAAMFFFKLPSMPGTKTRIARIRASGGPVPIWDLSIDSANIYTEGFASDGATVLTSATNALGASDYTNWNAWQLETETDVPGVQTLWASITHEVGSVTYYAQSGAVPTIPQTQVRSIVLTGPVGTAFGHIWLGRNTLPFVTDTFSLVSSGYAGELAADRFARICDETGIPYIVRAGDSEAMGIQPTGGTLAVLRACVETDYGVMSERGAGLEYIPRSARWNAAVSMAITLAAGQIADAPEPVRDDQRVRTKWTISRLGGGEGVYEDEDASAKYGTWEDSATINSFDDSVLENHAGFRTALGLNSRLRWPNVALNFGRNRTLLPFWRTRGYGWRFTVTTGLDQVDGNEPDLIMEGFTARLWPDGWEVGLNSSDARAWRAAVTDDTGILGRADLQQTTTSALISSTTLSIPITTATGYIKPDNTAGLWTGGVNFNVGGEKVTVTSITNGVGQAQTLNATVRGVGGFASTHASGTEVSLWDPAITAL